MKLGRLPTRHDKRSLMLRDLFPVGQISAPPLARDWSSRENGAWRMYRNSELSCCVPASFAHLIQAWSSSQGNEIELSDDDVVSAYKTISGWDGQNPDLDIGCVMIDAMNWWRKHGFSGHRIRAYVKVDPTNRLEMEAAINLFGGVTVGADMPTSAKGSSALWDIAPANHWSPEYRPGSWGGHAMACVGYSHTNLILVTWGRIQLATRNWAATYLDEAYAAISDEWVDATKRAPNGFDLAALSRALDAIA